MRSIQFMLLSSTALLAAPAYAQTEAAVAADATTTVGDEIIVIGRGETRQVQQLSSEDIATLVPGTSPLKAIAKLPGVNFQSADAFGAYEWSQRVSIRSFNQNQLGFTLDGVPLGDASYGNTNGLHISRAISSENVGRVVVAQGQGSVGAQATNNLGGTIETFSSDPASEFGLTANGTYGSDETYRGFVRMDTGEWLGGARGYLSYGHLTTDKWKGFGKQRANQVNAKVVVPIGDATLTGFFDFSNRVEQDYQDLSLGQIRRLGYGNDNIADNYALAIQIADIANNIDNANNTTGALGPDGFSDVTGNAPTNPAAGTAYPAPYTSIDDVYYDAAGLREDYLGYVNLKVPFGSTVTLSLTPYFHDNHGQGLWFTPYVPSPNGVPISVRTTEYDIRRKGVFGSLAAEFGSNQLTVGGWYEDNDFRQSRRFYALQSRTQPGRSARDYQSNPFFTQWYYNYTTETLQYYVDDTLTLGGLKINAGWKGFQVKNKAKPVVAGALASGEIEAKDWFQPHVGATYALTDTIEGYAGFTQSVRAFTSSATSGPFATTQAGFAALTAGNTKLKPEESDTYEAGLRLKSGMFSASLGGYYVNFRNRLLGVTVGAGIVGNPAILQNVGGVRSYGLEAAIEARLGNGFNAYASYSYNDATYRDDVTTRNGAGVATVIPTGGKTVVDAPRHLAKGELSYDTGAGPFARVGVDFMSKRYFTYLNDQSVGDRALVEATIGYTFTSGALDGWAVQGNVTNAFDIDYVSTIGSNGYGNSGDNQTLLAGAPRQFFATLKTKF